jgi:acyl-CoA thioesterase FadM
MDLTSHALAQEMGITREQTLGPASYGFPAVRADAEFLSPALHYAQREIRTTVPKVGRTSLQLKHEVLRVADGKPLARGRPCVSTSAAGAGGSAKWWRVR